MRKYVFQLVLTAVMLLVLTACNGNFNSETDTSEQEPSIIYNQSVDELQDWPILSGEVYENENLGIRMIFPYEYTGKVTVVEFEDSLVMVHTATNAILSERYGGDYPFGTLFRVFRLPLYDEDTLQFHLQNGILLFYDDEYAMMLATPTDVQYDTENMDSPETLEFLEFSDRNLVDIIAMNISTLS